MIINHPKNIGLVFEAAVAYFSVSVAETQEENSSEMSQVQPSTSEEVGSQDQLPLHETR